MNLKSKLLSLLLSVAMILSLFSVNAFAASFNPVVDTITESGDARINTLLAAIEKQNFTSPAASTVQNYISYFIFDSKYAAIGGQTFPYTNEAGYTSTVSDGYYTISGINGSGCFAYAKFGMNVIYGQTGKVLNEGEAAGSMTASGVETFLRTYAQAGEQLRVGNAHSVMFISCVPGGFYYLDTWDSYHVRLHFATFASWANACNKVGIACTLYNANTNVNDVSKQDVSVSEGESTLTITPGNYPNGQVISGSFNLSGTVSSNYKITEFTGTIYNADGTVNQSRTTIPDSTVVSITSSAVNNALSFGSLKVDQSYYLVYYATDESGRSVMWSSDMFTMISNTSEVSSLTITPGEYPKGTLAPASYTLTGTVSSNYNITSVSGFIVNENGDVIQSASKQNLNTKTFNIENSGIDNALKFGSLPDGNYYLMYAATDASDNSVTWTSTIFTISSTANSLPVEPEPDPEPEEPGSPNEAASTLVITPSVYPTGTIPKGAQPLRGSITSNYNITSVEASICTAHDTVVQTVYDEPNSKTYSLSGKVNSSMKFGALDAGYYYLRYVATDSSGNVVDWTSPVFAVSNASLFVDVPDTAWYCQPTYYLASLGIVSGISNGNGNLEFQAYSYLTRAQMVVLLYNTECLLNGVPDTTGVEVPFVDLTYSWYREAVKWAYSRGIVTGVSEIEFAPNSNVTREQLAVLLYRYSNGTNFDMDYLSGYLDASAVHGWAYEGMNWCVGNGIISSTDSEGSLLEPVSNATRSQAIVMLYRTFFQ